MQKNFDDAKKAFGFRFSDDPNQDRVLKTNLLSDLSSSITLDQKGPSHGRPSGDYMLDLMDKRMEDISSYVGSLEQRFGKTQREHELRITKLQEENKELGEAVMSLKEHISNVLATD